MLGIYLSDICFVVQHDVFIKIVEDSDFVAIVKHIQNYVYYMQNLENIVSNTLNDILLANIFQSGWTA